jgi:membrane-bound serine protease (ClpP class)
MHPAIGVGRWRDTRLNHATVRITRLIALSFVVACSLGAAAPESTSPPANSGEGRRVFVVKIHGGIDPVQGEYVHRTLNKIRKGDYDVVILDIDTPGGRGDVMVRMSEDIITCPVPTVAFVSKWALSAGAFIAMSAERIYMTPRAVIGAARGYVPGPDGLPVKLPEHVEEKLASANRAQFRALAESRGYPPALAEAMTDESIEVKMVIYEGKVQYLKTGEIAAIEADPLKKEELKIVETVSPKGRLVTFTAREAVKYKIARKVVDDLDDVLAAENMTQAKMSGASLSWSDDLITVLTSPGALLLLILLGFGGVWLEMKMPGFGFPGTIAVIAFVTVFASQFLIGNANAAEILLFVVGLALLAIEVFVTPGFGFIGGAGILCVFVSLVLATQPFIVPSEPWEYDLLEINVLATVSGIAGSFVILLLAAWLLPNTPAFRRLTLETSHKAEEGFSAGVQNGDSLIGQVGVVVTALRPAGKVEIGDKTYSVVSDGEFVDAGHKARIIRVDGPRIIIEPIAEETEKKPEFEA